MLVVVSDVVPIHPPDGDVAGLLLAPGAVGDVIDAGHGRGEGAGGELASGRGDCRQSKSCITCVLLILLYYVHSI